MIAKTWSEHGKRQEERRVGVGAVVVIARRYLRVETDEKNSVGIIVGSNFSSIFILKNNRSLWLDCHTKYGHTVSLQLRLTLQEQRTPASARLSGKARAT